MVKSGRALRYAEGYARGLSKSPLTNQYPHKGDREAVEGAREQRLFKSSFASFAMDETHPLEAVRHVGLDTVRARLVKRTGAWP